MAFGTLKADTLTHSTAGSLATNYVVEGSAKAWIRYEHQPRWSRQSNMLQSLTLVRRPASCHAMQCS
ncbi:MAG: hypothetical protein CM15mV148_070 [uncultured marine virus]|nr:MAG: hypothetical protein CM15mV148_070 [uncultured marine virus]